MKNDNKVSARAIANAVSGSSKRANPNHQSLRNAWDQIIADNHFPSSGRGVKGPFIKHDGLSAYGSVIVGPDEEFEIDIALPGSKLDDSTVSNKHVAKNLGEFAYSIIREDEEDFGPGRGPTEPNIHSAGVIKLKNTRIVAAREFKDTLEATEFMDQLHTMLNDPRLKDWSKSTDTNMGYRTGRKLEKAVKAYEEFYDEMYKEE